MSSDGGHSPLWKQGLCQLSAGGCAGFIEVALMHPLDLVKTRFQVQNANTSVLGSLRDVIRSEGAASLYKGIVPALLQDTPKRATKFFCFEQYKVEGRIILVLWLSLWPAVERDSPRPSLSLLLRR